MSWTGLVCAVLWRERLKVGHATLNRRVGCAFLTAVILHALLDTLVSLGSANFDESLGVGFLSLLVALGGLVLLIRRVREARRASPPRPYSSECVERGFSEVGLSRRPAPSDCSASFRKVTRSSRLTRQCLPIFRHGMRPSLHQL